MILAYTPCHWLSHVTAGLQLASGQVACQPPRLDGTPAVLLFTGTRTLRDLVLDDLDVTPSVWPERAANTTTTRGGVVHGGFARRTRTLLRSPRVAAFVDEHRDFVLGGHSLGGACAVLAAVHLDQVLRKRVHAVYTFGMPPLAREGFRRHYADTLGPRSRHFATPRDPVVYRIPGPYRHLAAYEPVSCDAESIWDHHDMAVYRAALGGGHLSED